MGILSWLFKEPTIQSDKPAVSDCAHMGKWEVWGVNTIGNGMCLVCHREVSLDVLINNSAQRLQRLIQDYDQCSSEQAGPVSAPSER